ncbi:hypothetical protein BH09PAT2_BH09PAT2_06520 [soil metagenome]
MNKSKLPHNSRFSVLIIILILSTVALFFIIQSTNKKVETKVPRKESKLVITSIPAQVSTKTFTIENNAYYNPEYGANFTYPSDWAAFATDGESVNIHRKDDIRGVSGFTIFMRRNLENMTFKQWFEDVTSSSSFLLPSNGDYRIQQIQIGNYEWTKLTNVAVPPAFYVKYVVFHKGIIYYVVDMSHNEKNIEAVLGSIRFDDP